MSLCNHCVVCGGKFSCSPRWSCGDCEQNFDSKVVELWRRVKDGDERVPEPIRQWPESTIDTEPKRICHGCVELIESGALGSLVDALLALKS